MISPPQASAPQDRKLFAGPRLRRLRVGMGLTQTRMADDLGISISYLNLIERNQRPLTAAFLLKLSHAYNLDLRLLTGDDTDAQTADVTRILGDPLLLGLDIGRAEIQDFVASCPGIVQALTRLYGAAREEQAGAADMAAAAAQANGPLDLLRVFWQARQNFFPEIDGRAEALADELRLVASDLFAAIGERLRARHGLTVRVLPVDVMPDLLRRLDYHGRQLQLNEVLDQASRTFEVAYQLGLVEARAEMDEVVASAGFADKATERLLLHNLASYFAAALMMPYGRFHAACEALGYDIELLQARFGAGFEQVAHRLTTLHRPGARGVPFFMLRVDRAGTVSKRFAPAHLPFASQGGACPLLSLHAAFDRPGMIRSQLIELEDGARYFTVARTVRSYAMPYGGVRPEFAIGLGCELRHARGLVYARGLDLDAVQPTLVGLGCSQCQRRDCRQRSAPPAGRRLIIDERQRGPTRFRFDDD